MDLIKAALAFAIFLSVLKNVDASSVGPPIPLTPMEARALQQFKNIVLPKIPVSSVLYNISRDDLYLMGWLRSKRLNIREAEKKFLFNLKWRQEQRMDTITSEDWTVFELDYPAFADTFDKFSRPTSEYWVSDWDVRRAVLSGNGKQLSRWMDLHFELNMRRLYRLRREGKNVTQAVMLTDVEGFSLRHGCPVCVQIFVRLGANWENHYPDLLEGACAINMTPSFQMILDGTKPFLRPETRAALKTYVLRRHWIPALDKQFDPRERSLRFGGTKERTKPHWTKP